MAPLPSISVITATYQSAALLERAMESVVAQAYPALEYIVLDGGSTDGTVALIQRYAPHIAFWRSERDGGTSAAYNEGIRRAKGEIIALLNADDWYEPGILNAVGQAFAEAPELDMVTCEADVWRQRAHGEPLHVRRFTGGSLEVNPHASPIPNARFCRRELFDRHGDFLTQNHLGQRMIASDLEFLLRLSQHPIKNRVLNRPGYHYLMHEGSQTMGGHAGRMQQMYRERAAIARDYLAKPGMARWRGRLRRWHRRGTTRDFYWQLESHGVRAALRALAEGIRVSGPAWVLDALRVGLTRGYRL